MTADRPTDRAEPPTERVARSRAAILRAAFDLCVEQTYAGVTMEAIATRARVGKPTLYRWWPSKAALVLDALMVELGDTYALPDSGDLRADLRVLVGKVAAAAADPRLGPILSGVIGAAQHDPDVRTEVQALNDELRAYNQRRIVAEQQSGVFSAVDPDVLEDLLVAPIWYRLLLTGAPITQEYATAIADALLGPRDEVPGHEGAPSTGLPG